MKLLERLPGYVVGASLLLLVPSTAAAQVQLSLRDGRVTLVATNATVRQILGEWARVGQTTIVNLERIPGNPENLQLTNVPEQEALDLLLRSVAGYMAAPRPTPAPDLSRYDRILVLPTPAVARVPVTSPQPVFQPPQAVVGQQPANGDGGGPSIVPPRGPMFPPQPRVVIEDQQALPPDGGATATPGLVQPAPGAVFVSPAGQPFVITAPTGATAVGTPRPGMVVQPQAQPAPGAIEVQVPVPPDN